MRSFSRYAGQDEEAKAAKQQKGRDLMRQSDMDGFQTRKEAFVRDFKEYIDHFERSWLEMDEKLVRTNASWLALLDFLYEEKLSPETKQKLDGMVGVGMLQFQAERVRLRKQVIDINRDALARFEAARTPQELLQVALQVANEIFPPP